ncbi:MAG: NACHT domain-containing protein, partial [Armatimonadetes bacterium]|nr:NACHT domain-containing protein [Armatimonadota bacterium]
LLPALQGPSEGGNLVLLRNQLAHGGGMTRATAEAYLAEWEPRFALLVERLALLQECDLCCVLGAEPQRLRGPALATSPCEVNDVLRAELAKVGSHVVLLRGGRALDLWPLCDYGRARSTTLQGAREAEADSPLVYFRSERDRLLYAALGVDLPHGERRDVLEEFRNLFRLEDRVRPEPGFVSDFEAEIRADAAALVGRVGDVAQAKAAIKAAQSGVLWITGPGGIGKSFLVAKLADDLGNAPQSICRIAWRFKVGDAARCSRVPFFRHAVERLAAWLQKPDVAPAQDPNELEGQLAELLDEVGDLTAEDPRGRPPRVLFVLDGLDEIQRLDPGFPELPFHLTRPNVVWLCAGRAERNLPQVFAKNRCTHVFPDGLPAMTRDDVRALLLEEVGSRKYDLLALDHEAGDEVANEALQAIVDRAEGLPLYVRYVVQDILSGHFRFADLGARLPSSLSAYYDDLLRRMSIGELQALLTPLVVTIAHAPAPLNEDTLHLLMTRRQVVRGTDKGRETLRQGLQAAQSMLRAAPAEGGTLGFEPYHPTFREHILTDATGLIGDQNEFAQDSLRDLATGWRALPQDQTSRAYALRFGPRILTQAERWDDLTILLTDLEFVEAKCEAGMTYDLVADYNAALSSVPAGRLSRAVEPFHRFVRANAHIFAQGLEWVIQRAYN